MSLIMTSTFFLLCLLTVAQAFQISRMTMSKNHQEITRMAILRATARTCQKSVENFTMPNQLDTETLAHACNKGTFKSKFEKAIRIICYHNVYTDLKHMSNPEYHFDNEKFEMGRKLITDGITTITRHVTNGNFKDARVILGEILHTLQDFYSHSNWIELGNTSPYTALIDPGVALTNIAAKDQETCEKNCPKNNCGAKLLQNILTEKILTSGYFGLNKPTGKCSHGGITDITTGTFRSWDGINKDSSDSSHGSLHERAADVAIDASVKLLENIQDKINSSSYLRLMGLHGPEVKGGLKALPFSLFETRYPDASEKPNEIVIEEIPE